MANSIPFLREPTGVSLVVPDLDVNQLTLLATPPFTCAQLTGRICEPVDCPTCGVAICGVEDHWIGDEYTYCEGNVLFHLDCHNQVCGSSYCFDGSDEAYDRMRDERDGNW